MVTRFLLLPTMTTESILRGKTVGNILVHCASCGFERTFRSAVATSSQAGKAVAGQIPPKPFLLSFDTSRATYTSPPHMYMRFVHERATVPRDCTQHAEHRLGRRLYNEKYTALAHATKRRFSMSRIILWLAMCSYWRKYLRMASV